MSSTLTLHDFLDLPLNILSISGIKLFQWTDQDKMTRREKVTLVVLMVNLLLNLSAKLLYPVLDEFADIIHMSQWFLYLIFANNGFYKLASVFLGRKQLHQAVKQLERLWPRLCQRDHYSELRQGFSTIKWHRLYFAYNHISIASMFILFPFVQSVIQYWSSPYENRAFYGYKPYYMTYPFNSTSGLGYFYAYVTQSMGGFTVSNYIVGCDMLLMCTIYLVILHYAHLQTRINNFKSCGYAADMRELKDLLETHSILNNLACSINEVFRFSILLNYMISILIIVLIGIQITTKGSEVLDLIKFLGFASSATTQFFYICFFGNKLLEASKKISDSFASHAWYMADVRYQRMVVVAVARAQRPSYLTAYKFFAISMETYANLMTTAYQFFTLLKARMEEQ